MKEKTFSAMSVVPDGGMPASHREFVETSLLDEVLKSLPSILEDGKPHAVRLEKSERRRRAGEPAPFCTEITFTLHVGTD